MMWQELCTDVVHNYCRTTISKLRLIACIQSKTTTTAVWISKCCCTLISSRRSDIRCGWRRLATSTAAYGLTRSAAAYSGLQRRLGGLVTPVLSRVMERHVISTFLYPALLHPPPGLHFHDQFAFRPTGSTSLLFYTVYVPC